MGWPISPTDSAAIADALAEPNYVPAGVTQSFLEESRDLSPVQTIIFIGVVVAITLLLRCYARGIIRKDFKLDDWLALVTMVVIQRTAKLRRCLLNTPANAVSAPLLCLHYPFHHPHSSWLWAPHRVHSIHPLQPHNQQHRNPGLRRPHPLHLRPPTMPPFRPRLLLALR